MAISFKSEFAEVGILNSKMKSDVLKIGSQWSGLSCQYRPWISELCGKVGGRPGIESMLQILDALELSFGVSFELLVRLDLSL